MSLIKNTSALLLERDYKPVPQLCDGREISDNSSFVTFFKFSGGALYAVSLINGNADFETISCNLRDKFYDYAKKQHCTGAYYIGVFVGGSELDNFCTLNIEDYTQFCTELRWIADRDKKCVRVLGSQPDKIIDVREILDKALLQENGGYSPAVEMDTLIKNEYDRRRGEVKSRTTVITFALIALNCFMLALTYLKGGIGAENMLSMGAAYSEYVADGQYYRLFTAMFLHYGIIHLASNMLFLYIFGSSIERYYGKVKMLCIYLGSGIVGNILFCLFSQGAGAGASGAVFGLAGAVLARSIATKRAVDGKDTYFMVMFVIISICSGFLDIEVANSAHVGGFLFGLVSGFLLNQKKEMGREK